MIQNGFNDVRLNANFSHVCGGGSAQIVNCSRWNFYCFVKPLFASRPSREPAGSRHTEDKAALFALLKDCPHSARHRDCVLAVVFDAMRRKLNDALLKVDFIPM